MISRKQALTQMSFQEKRRAVDATDDAMVMNTSANPTQFFFWFCSNTMCLVLI